MSERRMLVDAPLISAQPGDCKAKPVTQKPRTASMKQGGSLSSNNTAYENKNSLQQVSAIRKQRASDCRIGANASTFHVDWVSTEVRTNIDEAVLKWRPDWNNERKCRRARIRDGDEALFTVHPGLKERLVRSRNAYLASTLPDWNSKRKSKCQRIQDGNEAFPCLKKRFLPIGNVALP